MSSEESNRNGGSRIDLSPSDRDNATFALSDIGGVVESILGGGEDYSYADTGDSFEIIDSICGSNPQYIASLEARRMASQKIMSGTGEEKQSGLREIQSWIEGVRAIL